MTTSRLAAAGLTGALLTIGLLSACTDNAAPVSANDASADPRALTVTATDDGCTVSGATAPSGTLRFAVTNAGTKVNEFYLLGADGLRIVAEVENIGPGLSRDLTLTAPAGSYYTACKPGMVGDGIRAAFAVSESGADLTPAGDEKELLATANKNYQAYVKDQTAQLVAGAADFTAAYVAGDDAKARALYPTTRQHWERIEPVAESFGDLDPKTDAREADLEAGQKWTGWHRIEKDLWPSRAKGYTPLSAAERKIYAADLTANLKTLNTRVQTLTYTATQIANGSITLMDEVATGKVTGEEEYWSRTDLYDFQGNVDGARVGFEGLKELLAKRGQGELSAQIQGKFDALQKLLDQHKKGDGFGSYDDLSATDVKALSDAVNGLAEPLSKLAAAVA